MSDNLQDAVARLLTATSDDPWEAADLETGYLPDPLKDAIATILNAVADGRLRIGSEVRREALEEAAAVADVKPRPGGRGCNSEYHRGFRDGRSAAGQLIRALIDKDPMPATVATPGGAVGRAAE